MNKEETEWSFVAALFVATKPLSARCDFDVQATGSTNVRMSGRPLLAGTQWVRVDLDVDTTVNEARTMKIVSNRGFEYEVSFAPTVMLGPQSRSAFVPTVP